MTKTYKIKLASAVVINGHPAAAGSIVDVDDALARRLLDSGKAELATVHDVAEPDAAEPDAAGDATPAAGKAKPEGKTK